MLLLISVTTFNKLVDHKPHQKLCLCMCEVAIKPFFFVTDEFDSSLVSSMYVAYAYEQWKVVFFPSFQ